MGSEGNLTRNANPKSCPANESSKDGTHQSQLTSQLAVQKKAEALNTTQIKEKLAVQKKAEASKAQKKAPK